MYGSDLCKQIACLMKSADCSTTQPGLWLVHQWQGNNKGKYKKGFPPPATTNNLNGPLPQLCTTVISNTNPLLGLGHGCHTFVIG